MVSVVPVAVPSAEETPADSKAVLLFRVSATWRMSLRCPMGILGVYIYIVISHCRQVPVLSNYQIHVLKVCRLQA